MPLYSLLCEDCDKVIERLCKVDETVRCRKCGKDMRRLPVQTSFILKGNGWATDGYAGKGE
ncbi:MAG: zinc ribbon domain-containing protein [Proteobacteria bacterium]|nr:zinc ribbon domain-containing protein [Pseudomonadota bacterium]